MSTFLKLIKYRKFLSNHFKTQTINKKYLLVCDFNNFNGLGLKLLKNFFNTNNFKFKIYKNILLNSFINFKLLNKNLIYFKFNKFSNITKFIKFISRYSMIPFFFFPIFIINQFKNIHISLAQLNLTKLNNINKLKLINLIIIKFIRKLILNYLIKLTYKLSSKCQL